MLDKKCPKSLIIVFMAPSSSGRSRDPTKQQTLLLAIILVLVVTHRFKFTFQSKCWRVPLTTSLHTLMYYTRAYITEIVRSGGWR